MMNTKASIWSVLVFSLMLSACMDQGSAVTVNITQPIQAQVTNSTLDVRLKIAGSTPNDLPSLTVILERRKNTDPDIDSSYANLKTFLKGDPYPFKYTWDTAGVPDGDYVLRARVTYTAGGFDGQPRTAISAPRTVTIDRSRPGVTSSTPAPDATNVLLKSLITVTFNKPVLASSLTDDSVKLFAGVQALGRTVKLSSDGKTLTVAPITPLSAPNRLKLELSEGVIDALGNKLIAKAWSWDAPAWVRLGELRSSTPEATTVYSASFQVGKDGNPVALWSGYIKGKNGYEGLFVSRWNGSSWQVIGGSELTVPIQAATYSAKDSSLVLDLNDNPVVSRTIKNDVYVSRWDGVKWQELVNGSQATQPSLPNAFGSKLTLDSSGAPVIGWSLFTTAPGGQAAFVSRWDGTNWQVLGGDLRALNTGSSLTANAVIPFLFGDKELLAFWSGRGAGLALRDAFLYKWTGSKWEQVISSLRSAFNVPSTTDEINPLSAARTLDATKALVIAWNDGAGHIRVQQATPSKWIQLGGQLDTTFQGTGVSSSLAFNADGALIAASTWYSSTSGVNLLRLDGPLDQASWTTLPNPTIERTYFGSSTFSASLQPGPQGTLYVSWPASSFLSDDNITIYRENR